MIAASIVSTFFSLFHATSMKMRPLKLIVMLRSLRHPEKSFFNCYFVKASQFASCLLLSKGVAQMSRCVSAEVTLSRKRTADLQYMQCDSQAYLDQCIKCQTISILFKFAQFTSHLDQYIECRAISISCNILISFFSVTKHLNIQLCDLNVQNRAFIEQTLK